jgi:hypothetical protein
VTTFAVHAQRAAGCAGGCQQPLPPGLSHDRAAGQQAAAKLARRSRRRHSRRPDKLPIAKLKVPAGFNIRSMPAWRCAIAGAE